MPQNKHNCIANIIEETISSLKVFRERFFHHTEVKWSGKFPDSLYDNDVTDDDISKIDEKSGDLRIWRHPNAYHYEFQTEDEEFLNRRVAFGSDD